MNYLYISKKLNVLSAYLNLLSSLGWISLVLLIGYYHIYVLNSSGTNEYYKSFPLKSFILNPFNTLRQRTPTSSVQATNNYAWFYISENGLSSFFGEKIGGDISYWHLIQPLYLISIIFSSVNILLISIAMFCFLKARSFNYLVSGLANLLIPFIGGLLSLKINNKFNVIWGSKNMDYSSPAQLIKFRAKTVYSKLLLEPKIPTYN